MAGKFRRRSLAVLKKSSIFFSSLVDEKRFCFKVEEEAHYVYFALITVCAQNM